MSNSDIPEYYQNGRDHEPQGIEHLTASIEGLTTRIDSFIDMYKNAVPIKIVFLIFLMVFGLIFGIEGVKYLFQKYLPGLN